MKRMISFLLTAVLVFSLSSCGKAQEEGPVIEKKGSIAEVNAILGYDLLELNTEAIDATYTSAAVVDDSIGQATYQSGKSAVELRMTLDSELAQGLAGYENGGMAGGVDAPSEVFSTLEIYVIDESLYYCEFSYTNNGYTCYLSLAETKTDFSTYSDLLISYVNQLYNLDEIPSFIYAIDPTFTPPVEPEEEPDTPVDPGTSPALTDTIVLEYYDITFRQAGESYTFSPTGGDGTYTWESADKTVAIVSPNGGTVTAVAPGTTTLTCTSGDGLSVEVIVRVKEG